MLAFIDRTAQSQPQRGRAATMAEMRADYDSLCRDFQQPPRDYVHIRDETVAAGSHEIAIRHYQPVTPGGNSLILYFHGGGFVKGSLDSHDSICSDICGDTGLGVIATDYRLAPEHRHPAQRDDCLSILDWQLAREPQRTLVLTGDSAGAWLAASLCHLRARQTDRIIGQLLIYPTLGGDLAKGSYIAHQKAPVLTLDDIHFYNQALFGAEAEKAHKMGPLGAADFANLPPTIIFSAACDPLHDDGPAYADRITEAGGQAVCFSGAGLIHGHLRGRMMVPEIKASFDGMTQGFCALDRGIWPY